MLWFLWGPSLLGSGYRNPGDGKSYVRLSPLNSSWNLKNWALIFFRDECGCGWIPLWIILQGVFYCLLCNWGIKVITLFLIPLPNEFRIRMLRNRTWDLMKMPGWNFSQGWSWQCGQNLCSWRLLSVRAMAPFCWRTYTLLWWGDRRGLPEASGPVRVWFQSFGDADMCWYKWYNINIQHVRICDFSKRVGHMVLGTIWR